MIIFRSIQWQNFLSTGDVPTRISLCSEPSTLIVGANGSGKSTLLDALSFALFGKPHRAIVKGGLINSINGKGTLVKVEFSIGPVKYEVIRGMRPNIFEIWADSVLLNQESHSRDYQNVLEANILKLNHKTFHQIVVLGSSSFVPFMQLPGWTRREVVEDLLDIGMFTRMNVLLKEKAGKLREQMAETESSLTLIKAKITLQNKHIDELKVIDQNNIAEIQREIRELHAEIGEKCAEKIALEGEYSANLGLAENALCLAKEREAKLSRFKAGITKNQARMSQELQFYASNDSCPVCEQKISGDLQADRIASNTHGLEEIASGLAKLEESVEAHMPVLARAHENMESLRKAYARINAAGGVIDSLNKRATVLSKKLHSGSGVADSSSGTELLGMLRAEAESLSELRCRQLDSRTYNEVLLELLKDTGIKTKVIKQYLPVMNKYINQYLNVLDFFVSFTLNESFEEQIRSRHCDDFSYGSFSEGEKQRIDLALLFTWRQIAKMKNSIATNLLILDETFDSSMDSDGVDNLLKIMSVLGPDTHVFVISHKQDLLDGKFPAKITFSKVNNFSRIV